MYLRISKGRQKSYLVIVKGYREDGKVKQKTICNLGAINPETIEQSLALGKKLLNKFGASALINGSELSEESRKNWGAYEVLQMLWKRYNLDSFFGKRLESRKLQYDLQGVLQLMSASRLCKPTSKLGLYENQDFYDGFNRCAIQDLYKALDELDNYQDDLKAHLFKLQQLLNGNAQIAFFDVTTMYFESKKADNLRDFGFSKDCKFNDVQIILSLLTDQNGRPLSYELFKGNTYEGHTLLGCLKLLSKKYGIKKAVIVADRGLYSSENLAMIDEMGFEYIVGTKLRSSNATVKKEVLNVENYEYKGSEYEQFRYKKIINDKRLDNKENIIAIWSQKRAIKDAQDRCRLIEKAMALVENKNINDRRGGKRYLKMRKTSVELDQEKIAQDAKWDGYYGISTNSNLSSEEVISAYHNLWQIEASFRLMKSYFETRPMFHWTEKRIAGHIMLNFMSMIFEGYIEDKINENRSKQDKKISANNIREAMNNMQKSILNIEGQRFTSYAKLTEHSKLILEKLSIKIPQNAILT
jgi:transposase